MEYSISTVLPYGWNGPDGIWHDFTYSELITRGFYIKLTLICTQNKIHRESSLKCVKWCDHVEAIRFHGIQFKLNLTIEMRSDRICMKEEWRHSSNGSSKLKKISASIDKQFKPRHIGQRDFLHIVMYRKKDKNCSPTLSGNQSCPLWLPQTSWEWGMMFQWRMW